MYYLRLSIKVIWPGWIDIWRALMYNKSSHEKDGLHQHTLYVFESNANLLANFVLYETLWRRWQVAWRGNVRRCSQMLFVET